MTSPYRENGYREPKVPKVKDVMKKSPIIEKTPLLTTGPGNEQYFYCGNTRIKIREHFASEGKTLESLIENVIRYAAKNTISEDNLPHC